MAPPNTQPAFTIPTSITVTLNVVVSGRVTLALDGHAVVEFLSTKGDDGSAAALTDLKTKLDQPTADLTKAITDTPIPTP